ncbi:hypothetical protein [Mariniblastus fucicola]|uniref:Uncharacterized protein n=1 Tax=Mariniblastus fucicola TaxID=980251 RepID=A0A5B9PAN3_9BACT|nr:hypothetical protein [Mariniblastus fucicola]QEG22022.1 hypothetical protein MFFC18_18830 [Mariniblastus fucicola]
MKRSYLPTTLHGFNDFCRDFSNEISKDPTEYGLTADDAAEYAALQTAFETSYDTSLSPMTRTPYLVEMVRQLRAELTTLTRRLVELCQAAANMTDAKRRALGITIRKSPTQHPAPQTWPLVEVRSQRQNTVKFNLRDVELRSGRTRKPAGVSGAMIYTFIGDHPPAQLSDWSAWGTVSKSSCEVTMPDSTPFGANLWVAATWLNTRLESGPLGDPVSIRLGGGVVQTSDGESETVETV